MLTVLESRFVACPLFPSKNKKHLLPSLSNLNPPLPPPPSSSQILTPSQIGKLALYTGAAGIHPSQTLPIVLDCGTANEENLRDPLYLGLRMKRPGPEIEQQFMDEFMAAVKEVYPDMLVQFEDFESEKAFKYLDRYKKEKMFNDDIQGTGAVVLAGYVFFVLRFNFSSPPLLLGNDIVSPKFPLFYSSFFILNLTHIN